MESSRDQGEEEDKEADSFLNSLHDALAEESAPAESDSSESSPDEEDKEADNDGSDVEREKRRKVENLESLEETIGSASQVLSEQKSGISSVDLRFQVPIKADVRESVMWFFYLTKEAFRSSYLKNLYGKNIYTIEVMQYMDIPAIGKAVESFMKVYGTAVYVMDRSPSNTIFVTCQDGRKRLAVKDWLKTVNIGRQRKKLMLSVFKEILQLVKRFPLRTAYYNNQGNVLHQINSDVVVDDICCMLGCTRSSLAYPIDRGLVGGVIQFEDGENSIRDCSSEGVTIPIDLEKITKININGARFILVVEKHTMFQRLGNSDFCQDYPCILITGKGMANLDTRRFLNFLWIKFELPVYGIFDCDPWGMQIYYNYSVGSVNMAYDCMNLTTPDMIMLGLLPTDLVIFNIEGVHLTSGGIKKVEDLMQQVYVQNDPGMAKELELMWTTEKKAGLHDIDSKYGNGFFAEYFLPYKLQNIKSSIQTLRND
ncbi:hypothetical protein M0R45_006055 [Rubus argutus]|uniref:DNA topoisomerase (ATP-hydrolyzing) n=1 Tax=Rubus argutus TaxID=59490 RepID=A0AAW1YPE8_RUBAR